MKKHVLSYVQEFCDQVVLFPFYEVGNVKPKRANFVFDSASKIFSLHFDVAAYIRQFDVNYVLAMNECIVEPFAQECGEFVGAYSFLGEQTTAVGKQCQELTAYYKDLMSMLKKKEVLDNLFADLDEMAETFGFEYDKKMVANIFKESAASKKESLQKQYKKQAA